MSDRATPAVEHIRCTEHKAIVKGLEALQGAVVKEETKRETAFTALNNEMRTCNDKINKLEIKVAKLLGGVAVFLAALQIVLRFIPGVH